MCVVRPCRSADGRGHSGVGEAFPNRVETLLVGESDVCETAIQCRWLSGDRLALVVAEGNGRPPGMEEVHTCIEALRSHAAPGGGQVEASFLSAGLPIAQKLLEIICFCMGVGPAPAEWKSAVIAPLCKSESDRDARGVVP
eukprot:125134-Chlamydomonas_euryale.AAC.3